MTQSRKNRKTIALETLDFIEQGYYNDAEGKRVDLHTNVQYALEHSKLYLPNESPQVVREDTFETKIEVLNCTSLEACHQLRGLNPMCLNFASAKNPGGGFLGGSAAQEESLARSSALYPTLLRHQEYYNSNRAHGSCFYLDYMIYSPLVPVFRTDDGELLKEPELVSFLTAPAVNTGVVLNKEPKREHEIPIVMAQRIDKVLSIALAQGHKHLVLGAWGCGVFRNDPVQIANLFAEALNSDKFATGFESIIFAVLDRKEPMHRFEAFRSVFKTQ